MSHNNSNLSFFRLMSVDIKFLIQYLSVYFPFKRSEIEDCWNALEPGTAHYSVFLNSTELCYFSTPGLCFNQNIQWDDMLRDKWKIGFDDPFNGYRIGVGPSPIDYDRTDQLRLMLPLSIDDEVQAQQKALLDYAQRHSFLEDHIHSNVYKDLEMVANLNNVPRLSLKDFESLFTKNKFLVLYNKNIWNNTLCHEFEREEVISLLHQKSF